MVNQRVSGRVVFVARPLNTKNQPILPSGAACDHFSLISCREDELHSLLGTSKRGTHSPCRLAANPGAQGLFHESWITKIPVSKFLFVLEVVDDPVPDLALFLTDVAHLVPLVLQSPSGRFQETLEFGLNTRERCSPIDRPAL